MASEAILKQKQCVIDEIKDRVQSAKTIVLFDYRGITDSEAKELRVKLRESNSDYKVYKNTLMARAFNDLGIDLNESLTNIRIVTGQSKEEMAEFAENANKAAKALSTTTTAYTDAALIYYQ